LQSKTQESPSPTTIRLEVTPERPRPPQNLERFPLKLALERPPVSLPLPNNLKEFSEFLQRDQLSSALFIMLDDVFGNRDGRFDLPEDLHAAYQQPIGKELLLRYFGPLSSEEFLAQKVPELIASQGIGPLYQPTPEDHAQGVLVYFDSWWRSSPQKLSLERTSKTFLPTIFARLAKEKMENEIFVQPPDLQTNALRPLNTCLQDLTVTDLQQGPWFLGDTQKPISIDSFRGFLWALERAGRQKGFDPLAVYRSWMLELTLQNAELLLPVPPNLDEQDQAIFAGKRNLAIARYFDTILDHFHIESPKDAIATSLTWQLAHDLEQMGMSRKPFAFSDDPDRTAQLFWSAMLSEIKQNTRSGNQQYFFSASAAETRFGLHATEYRIEFSHPQCNAQGLVFFDFNFQSPTLMARGFDQGGFRSLKTETKQTDDAVTFSIERIELNSNGENQNNAATPLEQVTINVDVDKKGPKDFKVSTEMKRTGGKKDPFEGK